MGREAAMLDRLGATAGAKNKTHCGRIPERLISGNIDSLSDYEIFETLLLLTNTRTIAKRLAKSSFSHYQSLYRLLTEEPSRLQHFGFNTETIGVFDLIHESSRRLAATETESRISLSDTSSLTVYLDIPNRSNLESHLAVILLNSRNQVLKEITFSEMEAPASIILSCGRRVLEVHASAIILATVRSGPTVLPVSRDVDITKRITKLATSLTVAFHEHLVFCQDKIYSLKYNVDLTSITDGIQSIHSGQDNQFATFFRTERSLENTTNSVSGFSDGKDFITLAASQRARSRDLSTSNIDIVKGSHKLWTLSDASLMALLLSYAKHSLTTKIDRCAFTYSSSFAAILSLSTFDLLGILGLDSHAAATIKLIHTAAIRLFRAAIMDQPSLDGMEKLTRYLTASLSRENIEHLRILFLDSEGRLRADEVHSRGTINHAPVYPREIVRRALELKAEFLILVHNHPSGDPTPSEDDIAMTRQIEDAAASLNLKVWDHIVIGNGSWFSFCKQGLLQGVQSHAIELYRNPRLF